MKVEEMNIVYIDDEPDSSLGRFLEEFKAEDVETHYSSIVFDPQTQGYEDLLGNGLIQLANILIIDSKLFENRTAKRGKFSGEEFQLAIRKIYPFIETIVISHVDAEPGLQIICKYNRRTKKNGKNAQEYYQAVLSAPISQAIQNIKQYRLLAKKMERNDSWEEVLKDKIINTLNGNSIYEDLTKDDLNKIIEAFKEIQEKLDG